MWPWQVSARKSSNLLALTLLRCIREEVTTKQQDQISGHSSSECSQTSRQGKDVSQSVLIQVVYTPWHEIFSAARCKAKPIRNGAGRVSDSFAHAVVSKLIITKHQLSISMLLLLPLTIGLCGIVTILDDQILRSIVVLAGEVALQDSLGTSCVTLLSIDGGSRHVRDHGVPAAPWVLCSSEWVVVWCWLWEPDVTAVAVEVTTRQRFGNILLDDDRTSGGVDEPCTYNVLADMDHG